ncbi:MAG: hypothetical protein HC801_01325 [Nitrospira sp.]|nr:hypothetical protein [Nitrospira sp.]
MKYLLLVHHTEETFNKIPEGKRNDMLTVEVRPLIEVSGLPSEERSRA